MDCLSCKAKAGEIVLSPGPEIFGGEYWRVDHAYPTALKGWLVIILQRHVEALHELTAEEHRELSEIQQKLIPALRKMTNCAKEYLVCFAEKEGFNHIHFHLIARSVDLPSMLKGKEIFAVLSPSKDNAVSEEEITEFCSKIRSEIEQH